MKFIKKYWVDILLFFGIILAVDPIGDRFCTTTKVIKLSTAPPCNPGLYIIWSDVGIIFILLALYIGTKKFLKKNKKHN